jgi:hypothetical protein
MSSFNVISQKNGSERVYKVVDITEEYQYDNQLSNIIASRSLWSEAAKREDQNQIDKTNAAIRAAFKRASLLAVSSP